jgi:hypothetical protein
MRMQLVKWGLALLAAGALVVASYISVPADEEKSTASAEMVARGRYLLMVGGCHDCHTPKIFTDRGPMPDTTRLLMGHPADETMPPVPVDVLGEGKWGFVGNAGLTAFAGPWGVSFTANLTSDKETGIGSWTEEQFIKALRTGKHRGFGKPILPPMPWFNLAEATDADLKAMLAFMKSTKPISNEVPAPVPPAKK